jgi:hypothetical protein
MNEQQRLIDWLLEDVTPRIRKSGDAPGELLKFANEQNMEPAMLEKMGQLFNTAKTICFLEKSANRGADFPIVDVPKLVDDYLAIPDETTKSANAYHDYQRNVVTPNNTLLTDMKCTGGIHDHFPMDLFDKGGTVEEESDWVEASSLNETKPIMEAWKKKANTNHPDKCPRCGQKCSTSKDEIKCACGYSCKMNKKASVADAHIMKSEIDSINQCIFDANEDCAEIFRKWAHKLRQDPGMEFSSLESVAWKLHGDEVRPTMDKFASALQGQRLQLTRASNAGPDRLLDDSNGFLADVKIVSDRQAKIAAWELQRETLAHEVSEIEDTLFTGGDESFFFKAAGAVAMDPERKERQRKARKDWAKLTGEPPREDASSPDNPSHKQKSSPADESEVITMESTRPKVDTGGDPNKSPWKTVPDSLFNSDMLQPFKDVYWNKFKDLTNKGKNYDQEYVDNAAHNVKAQAMLQNLLTTDEVLNQADPEKVMSLYNTIRQTSPGLSNDINVMRVALRSGIQHEGISPFDVKSFADTEKARLKVEDDMKRMRDNDYTTGGSGKVKYSQPDHGDKD